MASLFTLKVYGVHHIKHWRLCMWWGFSVSDNWLVTFEWSKVLAPMTGKGVWPAKRGRSYTGFDLTGNEMRYWISPCITSSGLDPRTTSVTHNGKMCNRSKSWVWMQRRKLSSLSLSLLHFSPFIKILFLVCKYLFKLSVNHMQSWQGSWSMSSISCIHDPLSLACDIYHPLVVCAALLVDLWLV